MRKYFFLVIILSIGSLGDLKSQTVKIGQSANEIKLLIEWITKDHNKPDTYGRYSDARYNSNVLYNNGQINEVVQCVQNEFIYDFMMNVNFCKHFIMNQGVLSYILTQYENLSLEKIQKLYNENYSDTKIGNLYFDDEFTHYSKLYLASNGKATLEYKMVDKVLYKSLEKEIERRKKIVTYKQSLKNQENIKEDEIVSKYYDLSQHDTTTYKLLGDKIRKDLVKYSIFSGRRYMNYSWRIPSFEKIFESKDKVYFYKNSFIVHYETGHGGSTYDYLELQKIIPMLNKEENTDNLFNTFNQIISWTDIKPNLKISGYDVRSEANYTIDINYIKGISTIKIKKGKFEFISNPPSDDLLEQITSKINEKTTDLKGNYFVYYTYSNIMTEINLFVELVKI
jgi:hypothetical protein